MFCIGKIIADNATPPSTVFLFWLNLWYHSGSAPVAQLDRVAVSETVGREFKSRRVHQCFKS